tara:strand:- start:3958 stop:4251 length:294 start_codon:yes stop_codon:yes gene_type:complete
MNIKNKQILESILVKEIKKIIKTEKIKINLDKLLKFPLIGKNTALDSIALINFLSGVETETNKFFKTKIVIADENLLNNLKILSNLETLCKHILKKI